MSEKFIIDKIRAIEIIDSRGNPTVRTFVRTKGGVESFGDAPSGASKGSREALEIRDSKSMSVKDAVNNVNYAINDALRGFDVRDQRTLDETMISLDSTENKSKIGANAMISTSIGMVKTASMALGFETVKYIAGPRPLTIPTPLLNIINGGVHAGNSLKVQEFIIIPAGFNTFKEALFASIDVYRYLKGLITEKYGKIYTAVGDEGGFAPPLSQTREALDLILSAIDNLGYSGKVFMGMDAASSEFFKDGKYEIDGKVMSEEEMIDYYYDLKKQYPIKYIEDPFDENSFDAFAELQKKLPEVIITGDDLYVTNTKYLKKGIERGSTSGVIVKLNQIGTFSETFDFVEMAKKNRIRTVVSHRSGETEDNFIADMAVGLQSDFIKTGAPARGERTSKYNRLLEIESSYNTKYKGTDAF
ncbi:phosphopyruvate hydratase [Sulfuracidifex tepidarius]|uniref:Enolase n=1 Tax=Sulfuracidifex tepidarius TaxID=1294262 RepID=A0A510E221_9CREN|nr:phosphopyruvate hydratase [Sulfuracidifex tepidarius]BBG26551.1 Enolase [Sulfuracidifex tepidarius]